MIRKVRSHLTQNESLLFEISSPGKRGYQLPDLDVPAVDPAEALGSENVRSEIEGFPEVSEVEAIHFDGTINGVERALMFIGNKATTTHVPGVGFIVCILETNGELRIHPGDWIIRQSVDNFSGCKPEVFGVTYEACD